MVVDECIVILVDETHTHLYKGFKCVPSTEALSLVHQTEVLALKSPKIMVNKELHKVLSIKTFSKFDKKFSNSKTILARRPIYNTSINLAIL